MTKEQLIKVLEFEKNIGSDLDTVWSLKSSQPSKHSFYFSQDENKLFYVNSSNVINTIDVSLGMIIDKDSLFKNFDAVSISNDSKNAIGIKNMSFVAIQNINSINFSSTFSIDNPLEVKYSNIYYEKSISLSDCLIYFEPNDSAFVLFQNYNVKVVKPKISIDNYFFNGIFKYPIKNGPSNVKYYFNYLNETQYTRFMTYGLEYFLYNYKGYSKLDLFYKDSLYISVDEPKLISMTFLPKSSLFVGLHDDGVLYKRNFNDITKKDTVYKNLKPSNIILFTKSGKYLIASHLDSSLTILDWDRKILIDSAKFPNKIASIEVSQKNNYLAIALKDGKIYLFKNSIFINGDIDTTHNQDTNKTIPKHDTVKTLLNEKYFTYPIPCIETAKFNFTVDEPCNVKIDIYDSEGNYVRTLKDEHYEKGTFEISFETVSLPQGIFFCRIQAGSTVKSIKFMKN